MAQSTIYSSHETDPKFPIVLLSGVTVLADLAGVAMFPAIPGMIKYFSATPAAIQLSVTSFSLSAGLSQLVIGPLTDRFGRKPLLMIALLVFAIASGMIAIAPSLHLLVMGRILQGFGASAMFVIPKAIARDTHDALGTTKIVGIFVVSIACAGTLGPPAFGLVMDKFGWQAMFAIWAVMAIALLFWAKVATRETAPMTRGRSAAALSRRLVADLLVSRDFLGNTLILACASASYFVFLSFFPLLLNNGSGNTAGTIGLTMGCLSVFFIGGAAVSAWLVRRFGSATVLRACLLSSVLFGVIQVIATRMLHNDYVSFFVPTMFIAFAFGTINPITISGAISVRPEAAGTASGISTAVSLIIGAGSIYGVGHLFAGSSTFVTVSIALLSVLSLLSFLFLRVPPGKKV